MVLFSQNIWVVEPFPGVAFKTSDREREVEGVLSSRDGQAQGHCGFRQVIREYWASRSAYFAAWMQEEKWIFFA